MLRAQEIVESDTEIGTIETNHDTGELTAMTLWEHRVTRHHITSHMKMPWTIVTPTLIVHCTNRYNNNTNNSTYLWRKLHYV